MAILVVDNGESYSDHTIYFIDIGNLNARDIERLLESVYHDYFVVGVGNFEWFKGELGTLTSLFHFPYSATEERLKAYLTGTLELRRVLYREWSINLPEQEREALESLKDFLLPEDVVVPIPPSRFRTLNEGW